MKQQDGKPRLFSFTLRDFLIFAAIFICALVLCTLLRRSDISDGFASPVFVLAVLLTSRFTNGYLFGTLAAFLSVIGFNYMAGPRGGKPAVHHPHGRGHPDHQAA